MVDGALHVHRDRAGHRAVQRDVVQAVVIDVADRQPGRRRIRLEGRAGRRTSRRCSACGPELRLARGRAREREVVEPVAVQVGDRQIENGDRAHRRVGRRGQGPARLQEEVDPGLRSTDPVHAVDGRHRQIAEPVAVEIADRQAVRVAVCARRHRERRCTLAGSRTGDLRTRRPCTPRRRVGAASHDQVGRAVAGDVADRRGDRGRAGTADQCALESGIGHGRASRQRQRKQADRQADRGEATHRRPRVTGRRPVRNRRRKGDRSAGVRPADRRIRSPRRPGLGWISSRAAAAAARTGCRTSRR